MICTVIGCWGGCCKRNEACAGYLLSRGDDNLLIDCGSGVLSVMQNVISLNDVNDVILTHYHYDHCSDAGAYIHSRLIQTQIGAVNRPLRFYGPRDSAVFPALTWEPYSEGIAIDEDSEIEIGPFNCTFLKTRHPQECLAVKVKCGGKTLVYTSDTSFFDGLVDFAAGADLLIAECSLYAGSDGTKTGHDGAAAGEDSAQARNHGAEAGHMTSADVARLAGAAKPRRLLLSHLPVYGDPSDLLKDVRAHWDGEAALASRLTSVNLDNGSVRSNGDEQNEHQNN